MTDDRDDTESRPLSGNPLVRGAKLASLPATFAARTTWGLGKRMVGAPAQAVLTDVQRRTADQMFSVLGQLKGGAMKFGQTLSVLEAALPEDLALPYRDALTKLQDSAPSMPPSTVRRVMTEEFGDGWRDLFVQFDERPAAAASIGQVHRAIWRNPSSPEGELQDVAVKLQYPGAAKALTSDLKQIARLARLFSALAPGMDVRALVDELQARVVEELDYSLEAQAQNQFHRAFADDDGLVIPAALQHTQHALVSQWIESDESLADIIDHGSAEQRDHFGEAYVRFLFAGPAHAGLLHADPHPGNFRILSDGRLGVVDYGAVARLPDGLPPVIGRLLRAATEGDYATVVSGLAAEGFLRDEASVEPEVMHAYLDPFVEPARDETFTFSREWLRSQSLRLSQPTQESLGTARKINLPREYLLIHRVWLGGIGVLCQLGATAPFRQVMADSLPGFADES